MMRARVLMQGATVALMIGTSGLIAGKEMLGRKDAAE